MWVACVHWNVMAYNIRASAEELFFLPDRNWDLTSIKGDLTGDSDKLRNYSELWELCNHVV